MTEYLPTQDEWMVEPLVDRARKAFAAYRGLGRDIIDELIFAMTVANTEVGRLRASHDRLLAAAKGARAYMESQEEKLGYEAPIDELNAAIAAAEELMP
jgi:hypothetical protein